MTILYDGIVGAFNFTLYDVSVFSKCSVLHVEFLSFIITFKVTIIRLIIFPTEKKPLFKEILRSSRLGAHGPAEGCQKTGKAI